jgi:hypothetical protein
MSFLAPIVVVLLVGLGTAYSFWMRNRMMGGSAGGFHSASRAADLATKLRLQIVAGDPAFDYANPFSAKGRVPLGVSTGTIRIESSLEGSPDGYPTRLSYLYQKDTKVEAGLLSTGVKTRNVFQCRFTVRTRRPFPPFEVISRAPTMAGGAIQREMSLPVCSTGDAPIDARYQVFAADPAVAQAIAPLLGHFDGFAQSSGVQIVGEDSSVSFVMRETESPIMASVLYQPELLQRGMTELAKLLGG